LTNPTPERASQVGGQLLGVILTNSKSKTMAKSLKFPIAINSANPLRKTIYPQIYPKTSKKYKTAQNLDVWGEQRYI